MRLNFLSIFIISLSILQFKNSAHAQQLKQSIRGTITDRVSQETLPGAVVVITDLSPVLVGVSDENGNFKIENVPVGNHTLKVQVSGYKQFFISNLEITSGKEKILNIQLDEDVQIQEIVLVAKQEKDKPINEMAVVSTKTFSVEETRKYAAAVNDPGRMATSFAGVTSTDDGNNSISIRGNSPNGLQWRMEGLEIPNPNHFSFVGSSGGGISMISSQLLTNSDFMTGAFASEYGNALSGIFDLRLRKGNNEKREYTLQAGFLGTDFATEGPFSKKYKGSYLINYRYSTLGIIQKLGVNITDASTNFQDLSYNFFLPAGKAGNFTVFGFNGLSNQILVAKKDSSLWKENESKKYNENFVSNTSANGITHTLKAGKSGYLKSSAGFSYTRNGDIFDTLNYKYELVRLNEENYYQKRLTVQSILTSKINSRLNYRTGFIADHIAFNLSKAYRIDSTGEIKTGIRKKGNTELLHAFGQMNYIVTDKLSIHGGAHFLYLFLNNTYSIEPRLAAQYQLNPKQSISLGYGLHGQMQPIGVYFYENDKGQLVNKNLKMTKSNHFVLSYNRSINDHTRIRTEAYYQYLYNVPVSTDITKNYSILNIRDGFTTQELVNKGNGKNYGIEVMLERFLHKDFYYLLSTSIFESKYKSINNQWYSTRYNTNHNVTFTGGKEWRSSNDKRIFGANVKMIYVGGLRETPIDLEKTISTNDVTYQETKAYTKQNPSYFRTDIRFSLKNNYKKSSGTLALDIQNVTNRKNIGGSYFDKKTMSVKYWYQTPLIPVLSYRLEF